MHQSTQEDDRDPRHPCDLSTQLRRRAEAGRDVGDRVSHRAGEARAIPRLGQHLRETNRYPPGKPVASGLASPRSSQISIVSGNGLCANRFNRAASWAT